MCKYSLHSLYLYLTDNCNLRCKHCWIDPDFSFSKRENRVGVAVLEKTIQESKLLGLARVKLTGGEPFLREDLFDILDMLDRNDIVIDIETNGTLITDDIAKRLRAVKRGSISLSIDSYNPEYHNDFRGDKNAFARTVEGAGKLRKNNVSFQVICSVSRQNIEDLEKTAEFVKKIGSSSLKVNPITPLGRADDIYKVHDNLSVSEILALNNRCREYSDKYKIQIFMSLPPVFRPLATFQNSNIGRCHVLNILGILCDGTVSFCGVGKAEKDLVMGNINTDSITDIWGKSPVLEKMREEIPLKFEGLCGRCIFKGFCLGECVAITYGKTKSFTKTYWFCEMAQKEGLFPEERLL